MSRLTLVAFSFLGLGVFLGVVCQIHVGLQASTTWSRMASLSGYELLIGRLADSASPHHEYQKEDFPFEIKPVQRKRRTHAHHCEWFLHTNFGWTVLTKDMNYTQVNATRTNDWDVIWGGYPHCGKRTDIQSNKKQHLFDWNMQFDLNAKLNQRGWDTLQPHQVWFPCMGCRQSYCDKVQMCHLIRKHDPDHCFLLPQDQERLLERMDSKYAERWVLKRDNPDLSLHAGNGVKYITGPEGLNNINASDGTYMVMPYRNPFTGDLQRKIEIKVYLAVTSVFPLRAYAHEVKPVILSPGLWTSVHDAKQVRARKPRRLHVCPSDLSNADRVLTLEEYAQQNPRLDLNQTVQHLHETLSYVLHAAQPSIQSNPVNRGIYKSQASCFSLMRADFGLAADGKPVLYEVNEFPAIGGRGRFADFKWQVVRELFHMVGLDVEAMPINERATWEAANVGSWQRLAPLTNHL